jgi:hypothetical protein
MARKHKSSGNQDGKSADAQADVNLAQREKLVMELRLQGYDFPTIANMAGYTNSSGAYKAYQRALHRIPESVAAQERKLDAMRIDALLRVYMPKALNGDGWSHDRVMHELERRAALLGLDLKADSGIPPGATIVREIGAPLEAL